MASIQLSAAAYPTELRVLRQERGLIFVEHDIGVVMSYADRVVVIVQGRVIESTPAEARANPAVAEAYLGGPAGRTAP